MQFPKRSIYLVTSAMHSLGRSNKLVVENALRGGVKIVQYREKRSIDVPEENADEDIFGMDCFCATSSANHFLDEIPISDGQASLSFARRLSEAIELKKLALTYGALFVVNDDVRLALLSGANGVHVGQDDLSVPKIRALEKERRSKISNSNVERIAMFKGAVSAAKGRLDYQKPELALISTNIAAPLIVGKSTHNEEEVAAALHEDIQYLNIGPLFATSTKQNEYPYLDFSGLKRCIDTYKKVSKAIGKKIPFTVMGGIKQRHIPELVALGCRHIAIVSAITASKNVELVAEQLVKSLHSY